MTARDDLLREMTHNHLYMTDERAEELVDAAIAETLTDPRHHERVAAILRREARINPGWLAKFVRREDRIRQGSPFNRI
ncbi:hypothetical protein [Streptomyces sp. NPDC058621]|uniref:hypothetical protein n=1 Tax=Streptomyces sp. NPDC058621 TaxID=3346561 RepID=UPI00364F6EFD